MADSAPFISKPTSLAALRRGDRAMGFHVGDWVEVLRRAPFAGPLHLRLGTTDVVMRRDDAASILVSA